MKHLKFKKGLDLPISGTPVQEISEGPQIDSVAVLGVDYIDLKPKMLVQEGDKVRRGTPLFCNKEDSEAVTVSPATGRVRAINRGARRALQSVVIQVDDPDDRGLSFTRKGGDGSREKIVKKLCVAGHWTAFRTRPYSKVPHHETEPLAIYITAIDTEPLAPQANPLIAEREEDFDRGVQIVAALTQGNCYVCQAPDADWKVNAGENIVPVAVSGPHPAGLAGTHLHFLTQPTAENPVWTIGYRDVIQIGSLFRTGYLDTETIISLSGPAAKNPRLIRTYTGASLDDMLEGEIDMSRPVRVLSGSVLSGRVAEGPLGYLGRYHRQVSLIEEDEKQIPLGWIRPMSSKFAFQPVLGSAFSRKLYDLTSNLNGGRRAMVPLGTFEELMPQEFLPTQLMRALLVMDTDSAQALGALELDEEDLGLIGFSCPAKYEYGQALRDCLKKIEKEG
ncbi:MAG: Na(+)-translocating NADH-quinone reductase subunit A [Pseudomonadota bacterium]